MGIMGVALSWLSSYLTGRTQSMIINGVCSEPKELLYGVPQWSVLGSILFTLYTTPLAQIVRHYGLNVHLYGNDTQVYVLFKVSQPVFHEARLMLLQQCLVDISKQMIVNKLHLNPNKTEFLVLCAPGKRHKIFTIQLDVAGTLVSNVTCARNLGVLFDNSLNMVEHVKRVSVSYDFSAPY